MTQLEGLIRFWEAMLKQSRFVMNPSTQAMIEATIKYLKGVKDNEFKNT